MINARAELVNVKAANGKTIEGSSSNGWKRTPTNAVELTLRVSMGAPQTAVSWDEYKKRNAMPEWRLQELTHAEFRKLHPPAPKPKKGDPPATPATVEEGFIEADEVKTIRQRLKTEHGEKLRAKYERESARINSQNLGFMERAAAFAMFLALRGQEVQLTLAPVQQGFKELFTGNAPQAQLGTPVIDVGAEDELEDGFDEDDD